MKKEIQSIIEQYENVLNCQQPGLEPSVLLNLMFEPGEIIQLKQENWISPFVAKYFSLAEAPKILQEVRGQFSKSGYQFVANGIPEMIINKFAEIEYLNSLGPQWERMAKDMQSELSVSASQFTSGRNFFIETDQMPDGSEIKTVADKILVAKELLSSEIPISYLLDTGGRGAHLGIVLEDKLDRSQFGDFVKDVFSRLPSWIDRQVGQLNQLERTPETFRSKNGQTVGVKLVHVGYRIPNSQLHQWISTSPVVTEVSSRYSHKKREYPQPERTDLDFVEAKAWEFIDRLNILSSREIKSGKIQVSCPNSLNHKSGKDTNKSAVIFTDTGNVWCSACNGNVANIFKSNGYFGADQDQSVTNPATTAKRKLF